MRRTAISAATILLISCAWTLAIAGDNQDNKVFYTQVNIWHEKPMKIYSTNYHKGAIIPVGTKVTIQDSSTKDITFTDEAGTRYRIVCVLKHNSIPCDKLTDNLWFGTENPLAEGGRFDSFTQTEKDNIKAGYIETGMRKEAVLMAYGYPPTARTANTEANIWTYWTNRWVTRIFRFKNDKIFEIQG